jgi:hypothetical protein
MNNWIILLTTAVSNVNNSIHDTEYRKELYNSNILKWLNNTNYIIVVVESSGYDFPDIVNERLYKISLNFETIYSSSQYEAQSIIYALSKIKNTEFYNNCTHILKVTGRYFLENIEDHLNSHLQFQELYLQKHRNDSIKWQHTEYFGIKKELFLLFIEPIKYIGLIEHRLYDFSIDKSCSYIGYFPNNVRRGGDNLLIENL